MPLLGVMSECQKLSLCALVPNQISETVLGEIEKNSFIALLGKGGHSGLLPLKTACPNPGEFGEGFYSSCARMRCVQNLQAFDLFSGLMSVSGS